MDHVYTLLVSPSLLPSRSSLERLQKFLLLSRCLVWHPSRSYFWGLPGSDFYRLLFLSCKSLWFHEDYKPLFSLVLMFISPYVHPDQLLRNTNPCFYPNTFHKVYNLLLPSVLACGVCKLLLPSGSCSWYLQLYELDLQHFRVWSIGSLLEKVRWLFKLRRETMLLVEEFKAYDRIRKWWKRRMWDFWTFGKAALLKALSKAPKAQTDQGNSSVTDAITDCSSESGAKWMKRSVC